MSAPLGEKVAAQRTEEVRRAARALLKEPLLHAGGRHAEEFRLVRAHATELRRWFDRNTGWRLQVDAETARLQKMPGDSTDPHAAEVAVARLRSSLGNRELVTTVPRRGYRLAVTS